MSTETTTGTESGKAIAGDPAAFNVAPKFTPGPWEYVKAEMLSHDAHGYDHALTSGGILGGTPDEPSWVIEGEIEWAPDARLIAAAPEMYAALKAIHEWLLDTDVIKEADQKFWRSDFVKANNLTIAALAKAVRT